MAGCWRYGESKHMTKGTSFRDKITRLITNYGSTVVITPRTPTIGSYGGYNAGADGEGTAVSTLGIPSSYLTSKSGEPFGKLKEGEVVIVLKYSETIAKDYKVTWDSNNYTVNEIKEVKLQDVVAGKRVKLSRRLD